MVKVDPVCGMEVSEDTPYKTLYRGKIYYFCSRMCKEEFERDPEKYLREGPRGMPGHTHH
ncbi:YHS domain-containing protein [Vulcanisaeta thermophila]|uniref:YHS domain-containing protein n=1 Tax=Vulcanisaeta thermophila TaxID=867917 RepID=UPI0008530170|nr:YHS domain-containing protein [Vulcanisaeta thermophila]